MIGKILLIFLLLSMMVIGGYVLSYGMKGIVRVIKNWNNEEYWKKGFWEKNR